MTDNRTQLACPDCGNTRFDWTVKHTKSGEMYKCKNGSREGANTHLGQCLDRSPEVKCTNCRFWHNRDDLDLVTNTGP